MICLIVWPARNPKKDTNRTAKAFFVSAAEIREANYDLSLSRYKETIYKEEKYDAPRAILERMKSLNDDIANDLADLEEMLG
jgi:type I restriction enzyme M protein